MKTSFRCGRILPYHCYIVVPHVNVHTHVQSYYGMVYSRWTHKKVHSIHQLVIQLGRKARKKMKKNSAHRWPASERAYSCPPRMCTHLLVPASMVTCRDMIPKFERVYSPAVLQFGVKGQRECFALSLEGSYTCEITSHLAMVWA